MAICNNVPFPMSALAATFSESTFVVWVPFSSTIRHFSLLRLQELSSGFASKSCITPSLSPDIL